MRSHNHKNISSNFLHCLLSICRFNSSDPVPFSEHRGRLLAILEARGWPLNENDIYLLEREVERAEAYMKQAEDLRKQPRKKDEEKVR